MFDWLKRLFAKPETSKVVTWKTLSPGDHIKIWLKRPEEVGIQGENLTFQRLDAEDIKTRQVVGYVIGTQKIDPNIETLSISVVKKHRSQTRLVDYLLLKEEIERIETMEQS